jgi:hypothetical protein
VLEWLLRQVDQGHAETVWNDVMPGVQVCNLSGACSPENRRTRLQFRCETLFTVLEQLPEADRGGTATLKPPFFLRNRTYFFS